MATRIVPEDGSTRIAGVAGLADENKGDAAAAYV
jgi:hypothetical protein